MMPKATPNAAWLSFASQLFLMVLKKGAGFSLISLKR
jgi:hypothetical protein